MPDYEPPPKAPAALTQMENGVTPAKLAMPLEHFARSDSNDR
jgi:hypothetical protein